MSCPKPLQVPKSARSRFAGDRNSPLGVAELDRPATVLEVLDLVGNDIDIAGVLDADEVLHDRADDGDHS